MERSQIEAIHRLTKSNQNFEKENTNLQSQVDNLTSTLISLQKYILITKIIFTKLDLQFVHTYLM